MFFFFFQAEDGIRDYKVTGVQTCALPIFSTTHAKLQRREGVWVLVDLDSTNGTFVDGDRIKGEAPLAPGASVRLGEIELVFEPTDDAAGVAKGGGTRMMEVMKPAPPKPPAAPAPAPVRPAART